MYPPATCPLPSQSHSDNLTVPGSSAARLQQQMPNGLKVRDHDWRSASSRDSAGPWNPRGKNACRESSRLKSARVRPAWADSLATAQSLIFRLLNRLVAGSRGAAHIAGIELLPEVRRDKAAVGVHTPCRVVGRRVRLAPHQEPLWDRLVCPVPSVDVVLVVPRHLPPRI